MQINLILFVKDMFYGTILQSGADAAVGLATYVAGSHEAFVEMMNQKLKELGIASTTNFTNCVGIHDKNHYSTAYDMAVDAYEFAVESGNTERIESFQRIIELLED